MRSSLLFFGLVALIAVVLSFESRTKSNPIVDQSAEVAQRAFDRLFPITFQYYLEASALYEPYYDTLWQLIAMLPDSTSYVRTLLMESARFTRLGELDKAVNILDQILPVAIRNGYAKQVRHIYMQYGVAYSYRGLYDLSLKYMFESLRRREMEGDCDEISIALHNIGLAYYKLKHYDLALRYYHQSLEGDLQPGMLWVNMGLAYTGTSVYDSAIQCYELARKAFGEHAGDYDRMILAFAEGMTQLGLGNLAEAEHMFDQSLRLARIIKDFRFQAESLSYRAKVYGALNRLDQAKDVLEEARQIAEANLFDEILLSIYNQYINASGDVQSKIYWQDHYIKLSARMYDEGLISKVSALEVDFSQRQNKSRLSDQSLRLGLQRDAILKKRLVIGLLSLASVLFLLVSVGLININRKKKRRNEFLIREVRSRTNHIEKKNTQALFELSRMRRIMIESLERRKTELCTLKGLCHIALAEKMPSRQRAELEDAISRIGRLEDILLVAEKSSVRINDDVR